MISRRTFLGLACAAAAVRALPEPLARWSGPPATVAIGPLPSANERFNAAMNLIDEYMERLSYGAIPYSPGIPHWRMGLAPTTWPTYAGLERKP